MHVLNLQGQLDYRIVPPYMYAILSDPQSDMTSLTDRCQYS